MNASGRNTVPSSEVTVKRPPEMVCIRSMTICPWESAAMAERDPAVGSRHTPVTVPISQD